MKSTGSTAIAVFASGRGSNFDAIHAAVVRGRLEARIVAVVSDRPDAPVLAKARAAGIHAISVAPDATVKNPTERRDRHEEVILSALTDHGARFVVLAGYMRVLGPRLLESFRSERGYHRIVNVHPSILPAFPGTGGYRQAFEHGAALAGVTVHLVDETLDGGPICAQEAFAIADCRSAEEVEARGLAVEHRLYPESLSWILPERFEIERMGSDSSHRRVRVRQN